MIDLCRVERRCARVSRSLGSRSINEIEMLRTARALRNVHADLREILGLVTRENGWTYEAESVEANLQAIEQHLRRALLDYPTLSRHQLREHVLHAFQQAVEALDLLATSRSEALSAKQSEG